MKYAKPFEIRAKYRFKLFCCILLDMSKSDFKAHTISVAPFPQFKILNQLYYGNL